jgi:hypothetical protein
MSKKTKERAKRLAKMKWPRTQASWIARWKKRFDRISHRATVLWADRLDYQEFGKIVTASPKLDKTAGFLNLVKRAYLSHVLLAIRTFDDEDLRSISLHNLIEEIRNNVGQLRRHELKRRITSDLIELKALCRNVRQHVNKHLAHDASRKPVKQLTYPEIDDAIDGIYRLINRYSRLLFNDREWGEPIITPSRHIFRDAWIQPDAPI